MLSWLLQGEGEGVRNGPYGKAKGMTAKSSTVDAKGRRLLQ